MNKTKFYLLYSIFLFTDILSFYLSFNTAYFFRTDILSLFINNLPNPPVINNYYKFYYLIILYVGIWFYHGLYTKKRDIWSELKEVIKSSIIWIILSFALLSLLKVSTEASRVIIIATGVINIFISILIRYIVKFILYKCNFWVFNSAVLIGEIKNKKYLDSIIEKINSVWYVGDKVTTVISVGSKSIPIDKKLKYIKIKEIKENNLFKNLKQNHINELFLYNVKDKLLEKLLKFNIESIIEINYIPSFHYIKVLNIDIFTIGDVISFVFRNNLASKVSLFEKKVFDMVIGLIILIFSLPLLSIIAILIKITSKGPIFYKAKRIGKDYKEIYIYKFRTMYKDADKRLNELLSADKKMKKEFEETFKLKNDPRVTPIGKFFRRYSIDEIPQIFNVLKMELSLIGPRPIVREEIKKYGPHFDEIIKVRPGITGLWQVSGRNDVDYSDRVSLDLFYIRNWSLWMDIKILFKTISAVVRGKGAY